MSLDINQIALHQLIKRDEQTLELVLRDSLLEPTPPVEEMVAELHRVYSAKKIKPMACLMKRASWHRRCVCNVRAKRSFSPSAARRPGAYVMNWRNTLLPTAVLCCFATTVIWRWSIC